MQSFSKTKGERKFLRYLSRVGYAARGTVYILTGVLAALTAAGFKHGSDDTQGALLLVHHSPFGFYDLILARYRVIEFRTRKHRH